MQSGICEMAAKLRRLPKEPRVFHNSRSWQTYFIGRYATVTKKLHVFCDFDGTITTRDTVDALLSELADPEWKAIEEQWLRGEIGSRERMARQVSLIRGGWPAMQRVLDTIEIVPDFPEFVSWCRNANIYVSVVSGGLDRVIRFMFERRGIVVDAVYANHLIEKSDKTFALNPTDTGRQFGNLSNLCKVRLASGNDKPLKVVITGENDFSLAREGDIVFAKQNLADLCRSEKVPFIGFDNFERVTSELKKLLVTPVPAVGPGVTPFPVVPNTVAS